MLYRSISIILVILCFALLSSPIYASDSEAKLQKREAKWIYESALKLVDREEYDKAIGRLNWILMEYPQTEYAKLAEIKKSEALNLKFSPKPISGISRASLVSFGTLFTTWTGLGSWLMTDSHTAEVAGVIIIASSLVGLAGSMILTDDMMLSDGQASLITFSGAWGIWQATGAAIVADADERVAVGSSIAGGLIGLAASASIVRNRYITTGDATMINFGGIWGTWFAICTAMLADMEGGNDILASSMIGGDVGFFALALLSPKMKMSAARARLINISGIMGTLYGLGTNVLFEIDSKRNFWSVLGIGSVLGLVAGSYLTRNYDMEGNYFVKKSVNRPLISAQVIPQHIDHWKSSVRRADLRVPLLNMGF